MHAVDAQALVIRDATVAGALFLLGEAVERIGTDTARRWLQDLSDQTARQGFCAALTAFRVVGTTARQSPG